MESLNPNALRSRSNSTPISAKPDSLSRAAWVFFCCGIFLSSFLVLRLGPITLGDLFLLGSFVFIFVAHHATINGINGAPIRANGWVVLSLFLLVTGALLSVGRSQIPSESFLVLLRLIIVIFAFRWICLQLCNSRDRILVAVRWLALGAALSSSGTLLQYLMGPEVIPGGVVTNAGRFSGFTGHVSEIGGVAAMGMAAALGLLLIERRPVFRVLSAACVVLLGLGLMLSGSVSGMIASLFACMVYVFQKQVRIGVALLALTLGGASAWFVQNIQAQVDGALPPVARLLQTLGLSEDGRYSTAESRTEANMTALDAFSRQPILGNGFDSASVIVEGGSTPHNLFIGALYQGGVLVALAILIMIVVPFAGRWWANNSDPLAAVVLAVASASVLFSMTAPSLYNRYLWIPMALAGAYQLNRLRTNQEIPIR